jgi:hypothetical protein
VWVGLGLGLGMVWGLRGFVLGGTHHRFITRPLKLPQFWHCTVMCSAPLRGDWNAAGAC